MMLRHSRQMLIHLANSGEGPDWSSTTPHRHHIGPDMYPYEYHQSLFRLLYRPRCDASFGRYQPPASCSSRDGLRLVYWRTRRFPVVAEAGVLSKAGILDPRARSPKGKKPEFFLPHPVPLLSLAENAPRCPTRT